jgi:hypothetical protein
MAHGKRDTGSAAGEPVSMKTSILQSTAKATQVYPALLLQANVYPQPNIYIYMERKG